jgi:hypothetical protein
MDQPTLGSANSRRYVVLAEQSLGAGLAQSDNFNLRFNGESVSLGDRMRKDPFQSKVLFRLDLRILA